MKSEEENMTYYQQHVSLAQIQPHKMIINQNNHEALYCETSTLHSSKHGRDQKAGDPRLQTSQTEPPPVTPKKLKILTDTHQKLFFFLKKQNNI